MLSLMQQRLVTHFKQQNNLSLVDENLGAKELHKAP
jgi:hypothetical protein